MARTRVRWGRVGVLALGIGIGVSALAGQAGAGSSGPAPRRVHVVRPGETLWGVARGVVGPEGDPRPVVDRLISANHLGGSAIHAGDRLVLPSG